MKTRTQMAAVLVAGILIAVGVWHARAGSLFTDLTSDYAPTLRTQANAALDALEDSIDGTSPVGGSFTTIAASGAVTLSSSVTVIGGGVTSRWDNAASLLDGDKIADDTIDDDSIDFGDVTGADLTLTDCGAITGTTIGITEGYFDVVSTTQLVFIASGVTNVIDADITN